MAADSRHCRVAQDSFQRGTSVGDDSDREDVAYRPIDNTAVGTDRPLDRGHYRSEQATFIDDATVRSHQKRMSDEVLPARVTVTNSNVGSCSSEEVLHSSRDTIINHVLPKVSSFDAGGVHCWNSAQCEQEEAASDHVTTATADNGDDDDRRLVVVIESD